PYLCGHQPSLADFASASQLDLRSHTPEWGQVAGAADALQAWLDRMLARPSMQATTWESVAAMAA
ncbi:glutathione binding-like protein, partial [Phenylobacterium sp.]|uniref:glutathione binding-like protein n=1 Tax=Phenylobacterium sp. TaxID=1871053 RepID=UPI002E35A8D5